MARSQTDDKIRPGRGSQVTSNRRRGTKQGKRQLRGDACVARTGKRKNRRTENGGREALSSRPSRMHLKSKICPHRHTDMERPLSTGFLRFFILVFVKAALGAAASTTNQSDIRGLVRQESNQSRQGNVSSRARCSTNASPAALDRLSHCVPHRWLLSCPHRKVARMSLPKTVCSTDAFHPADLCLPVPAGIR